MSTYTIQRCARTTLGNTGSSVCGHDSGLTVAARGVELSDRLPATGVGIEIRTSTDRTAWTYVGLVWPNGAPSATDAYTGTTNGVSDGVFLILMPADIL